MRLEFDQKMTRAEQFARVDAAKTPGRKHQHRPGVKARQRQKNMRIASANAKNKKAKQYKAKVKLYWLGELEYYPK